VLIVCVVRDGTRIKLAAIVDVEDYSPGLRLTYNTSYTSSNMLHADLPLFSFIGFVLVLLPIRWHWKARNVATLSLITWLALGNLIIFINTILWADNYANHSPIWSAISEWKLMVYPALIHKAPESISPMVTLYLFVRYHR
jgi:hypothetical protein